MIDSIPLNTPEGQQEMIRLQEAGEGTTRKGVLFPHISGMEWVCRVAKDPYWEFDGLFCGELVISVSITATETELLMQEVSVE